MTGIEIRQAIKAIFSDGGASGREAHRQALDALHIRVVGHSVLEDDPNASLGDLLKALEDFADQVQCEEFRARM